MREILAERLKQCRKEKGFTQREVAIYCDITEKTYQNYELMTREPKVEILLKIADVFEVSLDYLLGRTEKKQVNAKPGTDSWPPPGRPARLGRSLLSRPLLALQA